jgi:4,5-dihydroxyphthalate decarboxylase
MDAEIALRTALTHNPRTRPLIGRQVEPQGLRWDITVLTPPEMFLRQLKFAEFDVSEMSLSSLMIATSQEPTPWVALPVFTVRRFFHTEILVRANAGIATPADLRGKRVGVAEYQQTAALWSRGILSDEFGVQPHEIEWFMERTPEQSHGGATAFAPPPGVTVHFVPPEKNIGQMILDGELDATLVYIARGGAIDRSTIDLKRHPAMRPLFPDPRAEARRYYTKTGMYPINHAVIVRRSLADAHPALPQQLYDVFTAAQRSAAPEEYPMPYGLSTARPVLETIARYTHEQGLARRRVDLAEIFNAHLLGT